MGGNVIFLLLIIWLINEVGVMAVAILSALVRKMSADAYFLFFRADAKFVNKRVNSCFFKSGCCLRK